MKVYFSSSFDKNSCHVEARLSRDYMAIYSLLGIDVTHNIEDNYSFAHFFDLKHRKEILYIKEILKKKVIVSYFVNKKLSNCQGISEVTIPFEERKILNKCDIIIASCNADKMILIANDIKSEIVVSLPPLKEERFINVNELEKNSFFQYAGLLKNEKFALSVSTLKNQQDVQDLIDLALLKKEITLFVFGPKINLKISSKIRNMIKKAPKNIKFKVFSNEDIFKSAMLLGSYYIATRESEGEIVTLLEAMITKTQIFTFSNHLTGDVLNDNVNCIVSVNAETMANDIDKYDQKEISTIDNAYLFAKECDFIYSSKVLKTIVDKLNV